MFSKGFYIDKDSSGAHLCPTPTHSFNAGRSVVRAGGQMCCAKNIHAGIFAAQTNYSSITQLQ